MDMKLYKIGVDVAMKRWHSYKDKFLRACIDKEDLIQEANIVTHKAIEEWDKERCPTLRMYIESVVGNKMTHILESTIKDEKREERISEKAEILKTVSQDKHRFLFADLKTILNERDYKLIEERFIFKKNLDVIGEIFGLTKNGVRYRLNRIFAQCKILL